MAPAPDTKMGAPGLRYPHASIISGAKAISFFIFDGVDPVTGMQIGIKTGDCTKFATFEEFHDAWYKQFKVGFDFATTLEYKNRYVV